MKSQSIKSAFVPTVLLVAAVSLAACSPDIDITAPQFPIIAPEWQTFSIAGRFETDRRDLLEATILYDGVELHGARKECSRPAGCRVLELEAGSLLATSGSHTISFQVVRQDREVVAYRVSGEVIAERGWAGNLSLGPVDVTLARGERVNFEFDSLP